MTDLKLSIEAQKQLIELTERSQSLFSYKIVDYNTIDITSGINDLIWIKSKIYKNYILKLEIYGTVNFIVNIQI